MMDPSIFLPPAQRNLVMSWQRSFTGSLPTGSSGLDPVVRAELLGLCARTDPALLQGEVWDGLLGLLRGTDDSTLGERSRTQRANELARVLSEGTADCGSRFDALAKEHQSTGALPRLSEPDSVIQLVDDVDALARLCTAVSWIVDRGQPIEAQAARTALEQAQVLLERIGRRADCLAAAQERLEALRSTIDESVLSSDPRMSIQQHQAIGSLGAFAATVRRSAVWIAQAKARVFWAIAAADEAEVADTEDPYSLVAALRLPALGSGVQGVDPDEQLPAVIAGRILVKRPMLAAADVGRTGAALSLFWRAVSEADSTDRQREARCTIDEGARDVLVRFFSAGDLDRALSGVSVTWLGIPTTVDAGVARFNLAQLHDRFGTAELARHFADNVLVLWVGGAVWECAHYEVSGG